MKKQALLFIVVILVSVTAIVGCGGSEKKEETPAEVAKEQYQCPMKCTEELFDKPDTCKVCGMDLEKVTKS